MQSYPKSGKTMPSKLIERVERMNFGEAVKAERERRGMSQDHLAQEAKTTQSTVDRIERGLVFFSRSMPAIADVLGLSSLLPTPGRSPSQPVAEPREAQVIQPFTGQSGRASDDVPVYALVEGENGTMRINIEPIDWAARPEPLKGVKDGYYAYITRDNMVPAYRPGDQAIVHPKLPVIADETYIFYTNEATDDRAMVRHLVRVTATEWHVEQYNPPDVTALDRREWPVAHRIVGKYTRR